MNFSTIALVYALASAAAIFLLWRFSHVSWYWHGLAVVTAVALGFMPPMRGAGTPVYDMAIGTLFLLLLVWGIGELAFKMFHIHRHV